jgi:HIP---CoA ligase
MKLSDESSEAIWPHITTVPALLRRAAERHGARPAIEEDGQTLTWADVHRLANRAACGLIGGGIERGDRVAIWAPNWYEWIIAALAIHTSGAVLVPINTRMQGSEVGDVLARSGSRWLFCAGDFLGSNYPERLGRHRPARLERLIVFRQAGDAADGWDAFMDEAARTSEKAAARRAEKVGAEDVSDLLYTSGTTGRSKGVLSCHGQNLRLYEQWSRSMELTHSDRYLIANPFFHTFGYKAGWLASMMCGATILPHAVFDAGVVLERIERDRVSVLPGPPTLYHSLLAHPKLSSIDRSSLRAAITGAASIPPVLIEKMHQELGFSLVLSAYGLTECCGVATICSRADDLVSVASTSGRPCTGVELRLIDATGHEVPRGDPGEILIRGYNVMRGYFEDEDATRAAIDAEGWLHTGDVGVLDVNGRLAITDRLKDMYICGGFNCYPAEIERQLAEHPAVAQAAVIGIADPRQGEVGCAYIVPRAGAARDTAALSDWCRAHMANYKVPRSILWVESLPVNASGKVLKGVLRASHLNEVGGP